MSRLLLLPCMVLLASCAGFEPKPLAPAQTASNLESRTLADVGLRTFVETDAPELAKGWPRRSWDLTGLTLVAFFYHPSLDVVRAQLGVATAGIETAASRPNPTVSVTPGYNFKVTVACWTQRRSRHCCSISNRPKPRSTLPPESISAPGFCSRRTKTPRRAFWNPPKPR